MVITTRAESWRFTRRADAAFGVRVLTIDIEPSAAPTDEADETVQMSEDDTRTVVSGLESQWPVFSGRFLFLKPPVDAFRCELGELLLDAHFAGLVFVKGIWITSMHGSLSAGMNFRSMPLDRDRRSVLHASDLESQAAAMWVRALSARPELASRLFDAMSVDSPAADVKRVSEFFDTREHAHVLDALATLFFEQAGAGVLPMPFTGSAAGGRIPELDASVQEIEARLNTRVVMISATLHRVIAMCGKVPSIAQLKEQLSAAATTDDYRIVPFAELTDDQHDVLRHVVALMHAGGEDFELGQVDVVEGEADHSNVDVGSLDPLATRLEPGVIEVCPSRSAVPLAWLSCAEHFQTCDAKDESTRPAAPSKRCMCREVCVHACVSHGVVWRGVAWHGAAWHGAACMRVNGWMDGWVGG